MEARHLLRLKLTIAVFGQKITGCCCPFHCSHPPKKIQKSSEFEHGTHVFLIEESLHCSVVRILGWPQWWYGEVNRIAQKHKRHICFCFLVWTLFLTLIWIESRLFYSKTWALDRVSKILQFLHLECSFRITGRIAGAHRHFGSKLTYT
jgi:hypothetical protein